MILEFEAAVLHSQQHTSAFGRCPPPCPPSSPLCPPPLLFQADKKAKLKVKDKERKVVDEEKKRVAAEAAAAARDREIEQAAAEAAALSSRWVLLHKQGWSTCISHGLRFPSNLSVTYYLDLSGQQR